MNGLRVIMAVDMDYFYAQCEELKNPELKEKPLVVCIYSGRSEDSGAVATCNYMARKYGVKAGISIKRAKRLLKDKGVFVEADFKFYESKSERIMKILRSHADSFEQISIDEAFLDVSRRTGSDFERAKRLASDIKKEIKEREGVTSTIGIGPNVIVAKMASNVAKPDGLFVVKPEEVKGFLYGKPVEELYGVGRKTAERLKDMGIRTIGELASAPLERLKDAFGPKLGLYFYLAARGEYDEPVKETRREQIGRMATLKKDTDDITPIERKLTELVSEIEEELKAEGLAFRNVGVIVIDESMKGRTKSRGLKAWETDSKTIRRVALELFKEILSEGVVARRIGVRVSVLKSVKGQLEITRFLEERSSNI
jgi:DNA polymerase IV (DinB-like DNA polymerase)